MPTSETETKNIIDFIWEWAETQKDWAKLLVLKTIEKENSLDNEELQEVLDHSLQEIGLLSGLPKENISKPQFLHSNSSKIKLQNITGIENVNRLAKNQTINFSDNITVIYGDNGSGKSGYGRILNCIGHGYENLNSVLGDIFSPKAAQKAIINYLKNGESESFNWDGKNKNKDLEAMTVYNSSCVKLSLDSKRQLIITPMGFYLFTLLSEECHKLSRMIRTEIAKYNTSKIEIEPFLNSSTPQFKFIKDLNKHSNILELEKLCLLTDDAKDKLESLNSSINKLDKKSIDQEIIDIGLKYNDLRDLLLVIKKDKVNFTNGGWKEYIKNVNDLKELEKATKTGLIEIASKKGIKFYESEQYKNFIQSAENYIKILDNKNYPAKDDSCIFCLQPLIDVDAINLIKQYRDILNDNSENETKLLKQKIDEYVTKVLKFDSNLKITKEIYGVQIDEKKNSILVQPEFLKTYNSEVETFKDNFKEDKFIEYPEIKIDFDTVINKLEEKQKELQSLRTEKVKILGNIETEEKKLSDQISELKDRIFLNSKKESIKKIIKNHIIISKLNNHQKNFDTTTLSKKTSQARSQLLEKDFIKKFNEELDFFNMEHIKFELGFGTESGSSMIKQNIKEYSLNSILSEGEQKAISLAEFIVELEIENNDAPIIFDDPVNSLDQKLIDMFAERIAKLSLDRQVIVFTHNILFKYAIAQQNDVIPAPLKINFYRTRKAGTEQFSGYVASEKSPLEKFNKYNEDIKALLIEVKDVDSVKEVKILIDCYSLLRAGIESLIENHIFKQTVKKYRRATAPTNLLKINGQILDEVKEEVIDVYNRASGYILAHDNPDEVDIEPSLPEFQKDHLKICKVYDKVKG